MKYKTQKRENALSWEQIAVSHELTDKQLGGLAVAYEYKISLINENLEYNLDLINKIIEERRKN